MSNLDLKRLLGNGSAVRSPVAGSVIGNLTHNPNDFQQTQQQSLRKMDSLCEVMAPGVRSGGFGQPDMPHVILYSGPCAIGQRQPQSEGGKVGEGTKNVGEWEVSLPLQISVPNNARIASPGWFNEWRRARAYAIRRDESGTVGERCIPTTLDAGEGLWYEVVQEGLSGNVEPKWPEQIFSTVQDGTVVWRCMGMVTFYEVLGNSQGQSNAVETVIRCKVMD